MRTAALISSILLLLSTTPTSSQPAPGKFSLRAGMGYANQKLGDWTEAIHEDEQALAAAGYPMNYEEFGGTFTWSVEACYQVNALFSFSLGAGRQSDKKTNDYTELSFPYTELVDDMWMGITTLTGGASYWLPGAGGLFLGADMGVGFGHANRETKVRSSGAPELVTEGDWSGTGFVARTFAGYQRGKLFGKVGYQFMNLGVFDGGVTPRGEATQPGPPANNAGQPIETDFSGVQALLGIAMVF